MVTRYKYCAEHPEAADFEPQSARRKSWLLFSALSARSQMSPIRPSLVQIAAIQSKARRLRPSNGRLATLNGVVKQAFLVSRAKSNTFLHRKSLRFRCLALDPLISLRRASHDSLGRCSLGLPPDREPRIIVLLRMIRTHSVPSRSWSPH